MTRILVTGATGFVGRQIIQALGDSPLKIIPLVRTGKQALIPRVPNIDHIIFTDDMFLESEAWWRDQCKGVEIIVHAAWYTEPEKYLYSTKNIDCLLASLRLARGAASAGVKRFVGIGTCFEYDLSHFLISKNTPLNPLTPYAGAKAALYMSLLHWCETQSVDFAWCRIFYLYGSGEDERRLASYIRRQIENNQIVELTEGNQIRDYLDVSIAGMQIAAVAQSNSIGAINICSGIPISVRQFAEKIADEYGRRDLLNFGARSKNENDPACVVGVPESQTFYKR